MRDHGTHPQFVTKLLAHRGGSKAAAGEQRVFFTGVVDAAQQVQRGSFILNYVQAYAAAEYRSKIQGLQRICLEISADVSRTAEE